MLATTITLPPPLTERVSTLRLAFDALLIDLSTLAQTLATTHQDNQDAGAAHATQVYLRDIRLLINRVADMTRQATREQQRGDIGSAADTLTACYAVLQGELLVRLRTWNHTEPNPDIRTILNDWLTALETLQETPC